MPELTTGLVQHPECRAVFNHEKYGGFTYFDMVSNHEIQENLGDLTTKHVDINHQTWGISHKLRLHNREKSGFSKLGQSAGLGCSLAASNTEEILVK